MIDYKTDIEPLYKYMMDEKNQILFSYAFQINNIYIFEQWLSEKLSRDYHDFFMIENGQGQCIGFTFSYEFTVLNAHCRYTLCLFDSFQGIGYGAVAGIKMINYLFGKYNLNRIFISIFDYNKKSISNNKKGGFKEVAVLPDYRFYGGDYHALHILTISRDEFYARYEKTINKLNIK